MADDAIAAAFRFPVPAAQIGTLLASAAGGKTTPVVGASVALPLSSFNRHGIISGATGTGKTRTLQLLTEQLSSAGVPVFLSDFKGDLTGLGAYGVETEGLKRRTWATGQQWRPRAFPVDYYQLGGSPAEGYPPRRIPLRASVSAFGPVLMAKVLGLGDTQASVLSMVFHYADTTGLLLLDLIDLRALVQFLASDDAGTIREELGGISTQSTGVILRAIIELSSAGGDRFFGEPETDILDFLRTDSSGAGVVTSLAVPELAQNPQIFSTFLMWVLAELYAELPEVGDPEKPRLVFFFDEAHLLFADASKEFLDQVAQVVRLIRSKGVGVFFVTQRPNEVSEAVLSQLGTRVQHALRSHTPADAQALGQVVTTFPGTDYDLAEAISRLGTGQAVVAGLDPDGVPTPAARTSIWAPSSLMTPAPEGVIEGAVRASPLAERYSATIDRESAHELLAEKYGILAGLDDGTTDERGMRRSPARGRRASPIDAETPRDGGSGAPSPYVLPDARRHQSDDPRPVAGQSFRQDPAPNRTPAYGQNGPQGQQPSPAANYGQGRDAGNDATQVFGVNQGRGPGPGYGPNQGQGYGQNQGHRQGQGHGQNQGQNFGRGQGQEQRFGQGQGPGQGQGQGQQGQSVGQGYRPGQDHGVNQNAGQGQQQNQAGAYGQGQNFGQGHNPGQGRNQGQNLGQGQAFAQGQGQNNNQAQNNNQGHGSNVGQQYQGQGGASGQGQNFGQNYGNGQNPSQNFVQNQGPNQNPSFSQNPVQNQGQNPGQNLGPNQGQNFGQNSAQGQPGGQGQNNGGPGQHAGQGQNNAGQGFGQNQGQEQAQNQPQDPQPGGIQGLLASLAAGQPQQSNPNDQSQQQLANNPGGANASQSGIEALIDNPLVRQLGRTAVREISRGLFGTGRRRKP